MVGASLSFLKKAGAECQVGHQLACQHERMGILRTLNMIYVRISQHPPSTERDPVADSRPRARWRAAMRHYTPTPVREGDRRGKKQQSQEVELFTFEELGWGSGGSLGQL